MGRIVVDCMGGFVKFSSIEVSNYSPWHGFMVLHGLFALLFFLLVYWAYLVVCLIGYGLGTCVLVHPGNFQNTPMLTPQPKATKLICA